MTITTICILEGLLLILVSYFIALKSRISKFDHRILCMIKDDLERKIQRLELENGDLKSKNNQFSIELQNMQSKITELEFEKKTLKYNIDLYKNEFASIDEKYKSHFENLANRILMKNR